jgi:sodium--glutamate symport carrier gltS
VPVPLLKLNAVQVLALAALGVLLGGWLKGRFRLLDRLNIPAPVAAGMVYALLTLTLRDRFLNLETDMVLRDILMVAFFTTVGMSVSLRTLGRGGSQVLRFFSLAVFAAVLQNLLGIALARLFGLHPFIGIITGSVALTGGPATALALGDIRHHQRRLAGRVHRGMADPQAPPAGARRRAGRAARDGGAARGRSVKPAEERGRSVYRHGPRNAAERGL